MCVQVWCLKVSHAGDFVLSGSHDRSIRRWDKSEDVFFLEEEKEKRLERILDTNNVVRNTDALGLQADGNSAVAVPSKSQVRCSCYILDLTLLLPGLPCPKCGLCCVKPIKTISQLLMSVIGLGVSRIIGHLVVTAVVVVL